MSNFVILTDSSADLGDDLGAIELDDEEEESQKPDDGE